MAGVQIGETGVMETEVKGVMRYAFDGIRIFRIAVESFPDHVTNVYLILDNEASLVDVGFDGEKARADLERGFDIISQDFKEDVGLEDISNIIITHGHGDHFGMLAYKRLKGKRVYIHQLDSRIIKDYPGENLIWRKYAEERAREAGCDLNLEEIPSYPLDIQAADYQLIELSDERQLINGYEVYYTPGHTPGHICLRVGPILLLGDHMLSLTTPHQTPKRGWQGAGLRTYLDSLMKVAESEAQLGLAAHEDTIYPIRRRAEEIATFHHQRLEELVELCQEENNLYQLTNEYYQRHPELIQASCIEALIIDDKMLALEEIEAHVEYLLESDRMMVTGVDDGVIRYRSR